MFYSDAKQDCFVANILGFTKSGYYLDIGSAHARRNNNTFYFDQLGWKGVCVEYDPNYNLSYQERKNCTYLNKDALRIDYGQLLLQNYPSSTIDYLSLDIDEHSLTILKKLPLHNTIFKVITIEHDFYRFGDKYQIQQREILLSYGYKLLCADVYVEQPDFKAENCSFEDWWINPSFFDQSIQKIESSNCYPSQIITKFNDRRNWYR